MKRMFEILIMMGVVDSVEGINVFVELSAVPYTDAAPETAIFPTSFIPCTVEEGTRFMIYKDTVTNITTVICTDDLDEEGC
jgi:hypothetical protein